MTEYFIARLFIAVATVAAFAGLSFIGRAINKACVMFKTNLRARKALAHCRA